MKSEQRRPDAGRTLAVARRIRRFGLIAIGALLMTACEEHGKLLPHRLDSVTAVKMNDPEVRHPIHFSSRGESLDVEVPAGADGLSPNQHVDVYRFMQRFRREAKGRLTISVPSAPREQAAIARSLQGIQQHLTEAAIDYRVLRGVRYDPRSGVPSIRLAYQRPVAIPPACGDWSEDVTRNEERIPYPNWGCATQRNLAVMVDNARDLRQPQAEDPRVGERRSLSWSEYTGGGAAKAEGGPAAEAPKKGPSAAKK